MSLPLISLDRVFHIGSLNSSDIGKNSGSHSYEGSSLSVSLCPHAWRDIARFSVDDLQELGRSGGKFLDVHAVKADPTLMETIEAWGVEQDYVEKREAFRLWDYDVEADEWRYTMWGSEDEAFENSLFDAAYESPSEVPGPDGGPGIETQTILCASPKLVALTGMHHDAAADAVDALVTAWAMGEVEATFDVALDGVWWRERHDPESLSAPRGAIFADKLGEWTSIRKDWAQVDDEDELDRMPHTFVEDDFVVTPNYAMT